LYFTAVLLTQGGSAAASITIVETCRLLGEPYGGVTPTWSPHPRHAPAVAAAGLAKGACSGACRRLHGLSQTSFDKGKHLFVLLSRCCFSLHERVSLEVTVPCRLT
jgi:hypothetical protein